MDAVEITSMSDSSDLEPASESKMSDSVEKEKSRMSFFIGFIIPILILMMSWLSIGFGIFSGIEDFSGIEGLDVIVLSFLWLFSFPMILSIGNHLGNKSIGNGAATSVGLTLFIGFIWLVWAIYNFFTGPCVFC